MKAWIYDVEENPVYYLEKVPDDSYGKNAIDIPKDKFEWVKRVMEEYDDVQNYLDRLDRERKKQKRP